MVTPSLLHVSISDGMRAHSPCTCHHWDPQPGGPVWACLWLSAGCVWGRVLPGVRKSEDHSTGLPGVTFNFVVF